MLITVNVIGISRHHKWSLPIRPFYSVTITVVGQFFVASDRFATTSTLFCTHTASQHLLVHKNGYLLNSCALWKNAVFTLCHFIIHSLFFVLVCMCLSRVNNLYGLKEDGERMVGGTIPVSIMRITFGLLLLKCRLYHLFFSFLLEIVINSKRSPYLTVVYINWHV